MAGAWHPMRGSPELDRQRHDIQFLGMILGVWVLIMLGIISLA